MTVDFSKCIFCRRGIAAFHKENGKIFHLDLFASPEAGAMYECGNAEAFEPILTTRIDNGLYFLPDGEENQILKEGAWWDEVTDIVFDVMEKREDAADFLNQQIGDTPMFKLPADIIEGHVLLLAKLKNYEIKHEDYPNLKSWKNGTQGTAGVLPGR